VAYVRSLSPSKLVARWKIFGTASSLSFLQYYDSYSRYFKNAKLAQLCLFRSQIQDPRLDEVMFSSCLALLHHSKRNRPLSHVWTTSFKCSGSCRRSRLQFLPVDTKLRKLGDHADMSEGVSTEVSSFAIVISNHTLH
jgi:hypothetical protein